MSRFRAAEPSPDHAGLVCLVLGLNGELEWVNTAGLRLRSSTHGPARWLTDLIHPDDRAAATDMLQSVRLKGCAVGTVRVQDAGTGALRYLQLILTSADESGAAHRGLDSVGPASLAALPSTSGSAAFIGQGWDVTTLVERQQELEVHAFKDALTGVANRRTFMTRLDKELDGSAGACQSVAVLFADVDDFKRVNDIHGHAAGDLVLVELAARLSSSLRPEDTLARIGGDEFGMICLNLAGWPAASDIVDRLRAVASGPIETAGGKVAVTVSVGVAFAEESQGGADAAAHLVALADARMFRIKFTRKVPSER